MKCHLYASFTAVHDTFAEFRNYFHKRKTQEEGAECKMHAVIGPMKLAFGSIKVKFDKYLHKSTVPRPTLNDSSRKYKHCRFALECTAMNVSSFKLI